VQQPHTVAEQDRDEVDDQLVEEPRGEALAGQVAPNTPTSNGPAATCATATASSIPLDRTVTPSVGSAGRWLTTKTGPLHWPP
jgi:hypothetical protein